MCWYTYLKPEKEIAQEDINVYKILYKKNNKYFSYVREFCYEKGKTYNIDELKMELIDERLIGNTINKIPTINEGFHSYDGNCCLFFHPTERYIEIRDDDEGEIIDYYPIMDKKSIFRGTFIIPKGSEYYKQ